MYEVTIKNKNQKKKALVKLRKHEKECKEEKKLDDKTEESGEIFGGTTANCPVIQVDETDESNDGYQTIQFDETDDYNDGGILSSRWPVDHKTECGLCGTSFTTIRPNGSHDEVMYCSDGCPHEKLEEMDKLETQTEKERDQDNRSQYNISDKSKDMVIIAISSTKECDLSINCTSKIDHQ